MTQTIHSMDGNLLHIYIDGKRFMSYIFHVSQNSISQDTVVSVLSLVYGEAVIK